MWYNCNNEYCDHYQVTPTFTQIGPLCQNSTAPALPTSSNNGITGTWSPATINTATVGTTTYTFTPAAGQCATTATMNIVITTQITPTLTQIGPLCQNCNCTCSYQLSSNNGSPEHGVLLLSILQLSEPLLIHLLRLQVSVLHSYNEYCDHYQSHSNICSDRSVVSECNCSCSTNYIKQWYYRYLESCYYQYSNCRNHYLYIYSGCRSVWYNSYNDYCDHYRSLQH